MRLWLPGPTQRERPAFSLLALLEFLVVSAIAGLVAGAILAGLFS